MQKHSQCALCKRQDHNHMLLFITTWPLLWYKLMFQQRERKRSVFTHLKGISPACTRAVMKADVGRKCKGSVMQNAGQTVHE